MSLSWFGFISLIVNLSSYWETFHFIDTLSYGIEVFLQYIIVPFTRNSFKNSTKRIQLYGFISVGGILTNSWTVNACIFKFYFIFSWAELQEELCKTVLSCRSGNTTFAFKIIKKELEKNPLSRSGNICRKGRYIQNSGSSSVDRRPKRLIQR